MTTKMFLEIFLLIVIIVTLVVLFFWHYEILVAPTTKQNPVISSTPVSSVCFGDDCFKVELAKTEAERDQGLMYRKELSEESGMLFIFDKEGLYPFWMKNTLIPLDMVWIDSNSKVVFISQDAQPCKSLICIPIMPRAKAKYVLEINGGAAKKINLKIGDQLTLNIK